MAAACLALDEVGARGWSSYGWSSYADASRRRGWTQNRQRMGLLIAFNLMSALSNVRGVDDVQRRDGGWLNLVVLPDLAGSGCTIEVRGDLDGAMHESIRSVLRSLFVTVVRVWDPTVP